jgi:hypothetical protein
MDDKNQKSLVNEEDLPLDNALGQPIDYKQVLDSDLLELMGATSVSSEEKEQIYTTAAKTIENRVLARVVDELTDDDLEEWEKIPETDKDQLRHFLNVRNIDLPKLFVSEALIYKTELASLTHQLKTSA